MKSENFIVIQGWMCNELGLKGNELLVFALIYGFSQDGVSKFNGGRKYIGETFDISLPTVDKILQNLVAKNFIAKESFNDYKHTDSYFVTAWVIDGVAKKLYEGSKETLLGGSKETLLNNNIDNNKNNKKSNSKELLQNSPTFEFGKRKQIKSNSLYTNCISMIDEFINKHNCGNVVRNKLVEYLNFRIAVKDKPLYTNMWKGILSKLDSLHQEGYGYEPIIDFCLERGYLSFYPPSDYAGKSNKPWEDGVRSSRYTDAELEELAELDRQREEQGLRTRF